ncbi:MoaD/ThiS family protein [Chloroflexota bacterium]
MIKVVVRLYGIYKEAVGVNVLNENVAKGTTLGELLNLLAQRYGKEFENLASAESGALMILSGKATRDLDQRLEQEANVVLVPAVMGGMN